jgi:hypothetical protein
MIFSNQATCIFLGVGRACHSEYTLFLEVLLAAEKSRTPQNRVRSFSVFLSCLTKYMNCKMFYSKLTSRRISISGFAFKSGLLGETHLCKANQRFIYIISLGNEIPENKHEK